MLTTRCGMKPPLAMTVCGRSNQLLTRCRWRTADRERISSARSSRNARLPDLEVAHVVKRCSKPVAPNLELERNRGQSFGAMRCVSNRRARAFTRMLSTVPADCLLAAMTSRAVRFI